MTLLQIQQVIEQYNLHLTQFVDYFNAKEAKDYRCSSDVRIFYMRISKAEAYRIYH